MPRIHLCHLAQFLSQVVTLCQCMEPPSLTSLQIKLSARIILIWLLPPRKWGVLPLTTNCTGACLLLHKSSWTEDHVLIFRQSFLLFVHNLQRVSLGQLGPSVSYLSLALHLCLLRYAIIFHHHKGAHNIICSADLQYARFSLKDLTPL